MKVTPSEYNVNPDDLDNDENPTTAWSVGEHLDPETAAALRTIIDQGRA